MMAHRKDEEKKETINEGKATEAKIKEAAGG